MEKHEKVLSQSGILGVDILILVTLGTQKQSFERLLKYVEDCNLSQKIVVQAGYTDFKSDKMEIEKYLNDIGMRRKSNDYKSR